MLKRVYEIWIVDAYVGYCDVFYMLQLDNFVDRIEIKVMPLVEMMYSCFSVSSVAILPKKEDCL